MMTGVANKFKGGTAGVPVPAFYNTLALNGTSQYVNSDRFFSDGSGQISLAVWFSRATTGNRDYFCWEETTAGSGFTRFSCEIKVDNTITWGGRQTASGGFVSMGTTTTTITDSNLHHLAITVDLGTGASKLYLDGVLDYNVTITDPDWSSGTMAPANDVSRIGVSSSSPVNHFNGSMGVFLTFDSVLTANDITELQTARQPEDYPSSITDNYAVALPLNDGVVDPYVDRSGNGNDGIPVGLPTFTGEQLEFTL